MHGARSIGSGTRGAGVRILRRALGWIALVVAISAPGAVFAQAATTTATAASGIIEVNPGDTFSGIAARFTGDVSKWQQLYDPQRSGLPNPNLILIGSHLELVSRPDGTPYLRVVDARAPGQPAPSAPPSASIAAPARAAAKPEPVVTSPASAAASPPAAGLLTIGVLPNIPAPALLAQYEHVKRYLERAGSDKVRIATSPNFKAFYHGTVQGEFDLSVMAVHLARLAQVDAGMIPVAMYEPHIRALLVSPPDKPVASVEAMRGKAIAFANPESLVAMYGVQWLTRGGLVAGKDFQIKAQRTDIGVGRMVLAGEAAAAILSNGEFRQVPPDESARLKVNAEIARIPNFVVVAHPRLGAERIARLQGLLKSMLADKESGAAFAKATGVTGIVDPDETQLKTVDDFIDRTRKALGAAK